MKKIIKVLILVISLDLLVSCSDKSASNELLDKDIENSLVDVDKEYRDIIENIYRANPELGLYYTSYDENSEKLYERMQASWEDKSISYVKSYYDKLNITEKVYLYEGTEAFYIDLVDNEYFKNTLAKDADMTKAYLREYPDVSSLYDALLSSDISDITESEGNIRIDFSDGSYRVYNDDYILLESSYYSEGAFISQKLTSTYDNLDEVFVRYKNTIAGMTEVDSIEDIKK